MLAIDEIKKVSLKTLSPLTVITGDDQGQFDLLKATVLERIGFDSSDLNYSYFDIKEADFSDVEMDLVSLPFFADEKIIILDNFVDLTTAKKRFLTDDALKKFEAYLENPVLTSKLVIFASGKLDSKRRLVKLLKRDGKIFEASDLKEADLRQYFKKDIARQQLQMSQDVLEQLLIKSNYDFAEISRNVAFLVSYKPQQEILQEDIEQAIPKTLQDNLFDMTQWLLKGHIESVRSLVNDLRLQGEDEVKLLSILLTQFRMFLQVRLLLQEGQSERQIVESLSEILARKVNPYQVKFALRDSARLSIVFLEEAISSLIETDYQIKTGLYEKSYLFDLVLLKIALHNG